MHAQWLNPKIISKSMYDICINIILNENTRQDTFDRHDSYKIDWYSVASTTNRHYNEKIINGRQSWRYREMFGFIIVYIIYYTVLSYLNPRQRGIREKKFGPGGSTLETVNNRTANESTALPPT